MFKVFKGMETMKIMKATKFLLIVFGLASVLSLSAQTFAEQPTMQMHSTSTMIGSGSTLPNAASSGFISADDNLNSSSNNNTPSGPRRAKEDGETPPDPPGPNEYPLGDTPWLLMLLLALGYALRVGKKYGHQMPDAGK